MINGRMESGSLSVMFVKAIKRILVRAFARGEVEVELKTREIEQEAGVVGRTRAACRAATDPKRLRVYGITLLETDFVREYQGENAGGYRTFKYRLAPDVQ